MPWVERFTNLFRAARVDRELGEELQFHLDGRIAENIRAGMTRDEARMDATRRLGNSTLLKEQTRESDVIRALEILWQDLVYGARVLRKAPAFTIVAVLTLAAGIGANTVMFTVVKGVLLNPLSFPEPDRLFIPSIEFRRPVFEMQPGMADADFLDYKSQTRLFSDIGTYRVSPMSLTGAGDPLSLPSAAVTAGLFEALRVQPAMGRGLAADSEVLISDRLWRSRFGAQASVLGKSVNLNGTPFVIVGVMTDTFRFAPKTDLWTSLTVRVNPRLSFHNPVVGRLRDGVTLQQAESELQSFSRGRPRAPNESADSLIARVVPLKETIVGKTRRPLLIFMAAVGLVLLIACANVANLMLMRASGRRQEIAMRAALGASRARLVGHLLVESMLVAVAGGVLGLALTMAGLNAFLALAPAGKLPRLGDVHVDGAVLAFTLALSIACGIGFGIAPALQVTRRELQDWISRGSARIAGTRSRLRNALVVGEVALTLVLLTGAGLLVKSFLRLIAVEPGFRPQSVMTMTIDLPNTSYRDVQAIRRFHEQVLAKLGALPGVTSAGAVNWMPFAGPLMRGDFQLEGGRKRPRGFVVDKPAVSAGYFRAMGIQVRSGREFTERDHAADEGVVIISQTVGRVIWPGEDPIGKRISLEDNPKPQDWLTIVGVVDDVRQSDLKSPPNPAIYRPIQQTTRPFFVNHMTFFVRADSDSRAVAAGMTNAVRTTDRDQPVAIERLSDMVATTTAEPRFQAGLLATFSVVALLLSGLGVYGVLAAAVSERTREIGIRMALGASAREVVFTVVRRMLVLVGAGIAIGGAGALAATRTIAIFLFDVKPTDPATFVMVAGILVAIGVLSAAIPAGKAVSVDPIRVLRYE